MINNPFRYLWRNRETLLLSFLLAIAVWVSAELANDPNKEDPLANVPLRLVGLNEDLGLIGDPPASIEVRLRAPESVWDEILADPGLIQGELDLTDLGPGDYEIDVQIISGISPVQVTETLPGKVRFTLEPMLTKEHQIQTLLLGEPALGFVAEEPTLSENSVEVFGPETLVNQVAEVRATMGISDLRETINTEIRPVAVDENGQVIPGLSLSPNSVTMVLPISQASGYKDVAVRVVTSGRPATGYRITNILVSPPTVTLFSSDPQLVVELPGFVDTQRFDLSGTSDAIDVRVTLDLPDGVSIVGEEQSVTVQIGVEAIETSVSLTVPIVRVGLAAGLEAEVSPDKVDVILTGPLAVIEALLPEDVLVFVNLNDLGAGSHLVAPQWDILVEKVEIESVNPDTIEVVIQVIGLPPDGSTPTPTP